MKCYVHNDVEAVGTCVECGRALCSDCAMNVDGKVVCKQCAEKLAGRAVCAPARKDPFIAAGLSLVGGLISGLLVGIGQIYNGQVKKGLGLILINVGVVALYVIGCFTIIGAVCCLPVLAVPLIVWLYAVYDAYVTAEKINRGEPVKDWF